MDIDFIPGDGHAVFPGQLLSNLPDRRLTLDNPPNDGARQHANSQPLTQSRATNPNQAGMVITKIEDIFESIADCILDEKKELVIQLKSRVKPENRASQHESLVAKKRAKSDVRKITFPSRSPQEAWKFTALLRILELSHEALVTGAVTTKRDIYYRDPELFMKQAIVDRYVDDIAYTLEVERDALNVVAAVKGLVVGSFRITRKDKSTVDYSVEPEGILIPNSKEIGDIQLVAVQWILVIEKEATFRTLATSQYWRDSMAGRGILITAKGYPDIQTRQFLHLLSSSHPHIPIFALVDFDPDGMGIMSTYKHGSMNLAHEFNLEVPSIQWLGVRSSDFLQTEADIQGLLKLSSRDRRIAMKMLDKDIFSEEGQEQERRRELQAMLVLNVKAEIQILGNEEKLGIWLNVQLLQALLM